MSKAASILHGGTSELSVSKSVVANCGIDGKPVLFYARRPINTIPVRQPNKPKPPKHDYADLLDGLKGLGLVNVTAAQVDRGREGTLPAGEARVRPVAGSCGPFSSTFAARIREIMSAK